MIDATNDDEFANKIAARYGTARRFSRMNETRLNRSMAGVRIIQSWLPVYGFMENLCESIAFGCCKYESATCRRRIDRRRAGGELRDKLFSRNNEKLDVKTNVGRSIEHPMKKRKKKKTRTEEPPDSRRLICVEGGN